MKRFEVCVESSIYTEVNAETEEEAKQIAMESSKIGEELLSSAEVSYAEEIKEANCENSEVKK